MFWVCALQNVQRDAYTITAPSPHASP
jgi:hypothetical protein